MRDKYWAKKKYGKLDPQKYNKDRFSTQAGKLIGDIEQSVVLDLLKTHLSKKKNPKILEVACGPGRLSFYIEDHWKSCFITATDINENMLSHAKGEAKKKKSKVLFLKGDLYHLPFKTDKFDVIMGLRFSMHLTGFEKVLGELARNLRKGGFLIFDIYNADSLLRLKKGIGFYKQGEIIDMARKNGLKLDGRKGIWFLGETILRSIPPELLFLFKWSLSPSLLDRFSTKIVFCFKKI